MRLHLGHHQRVEQSTPALAVPLCRAVIILVVGLAGVFQFALIPEYGAEQAVYGLAFTALALFQLTLALLLAVRPGPRVYRVGIWGSGLMVVVYVLRQVIPLPGVSPAQVVDTRLMAATGLELVSMLLLAVALPEHPRTRHSRIAPRWWGLGGAGVFLLLWPLLTDVVQWTSVAETRPLTWVGTVSWSASTPILVGEPLPHLWLATPWWSLPTALLPAVLVGLNLWSSTRLLVAGSLTGNARRGSLLTLLPAWVVAPVCCSASTPLLALLGVPLVFGVWAAPFAAMLSAMLLLLSLAFFSFWGGRGTCPPGHPERGCPAAPEEAADPRDTVCTMEAHVERKHASWNG